MAEASIPVDLLNPGQVFACLGFMEAADVLLGDALGGFDWSDGSDVRFVLEAAGEEDPFEAVLAFLAEVEPKPLAPANHEQQLSKKVTDEDEEAADRGEALELSVTFPAQRGDRMALPIKLGGGNRPVVQLGHWADGSNLNNFKLYSGNRSACSIASAMLRGVHVKSAKSPKTDAQSQEVRTKGVRQLWEESRAVLTKAPFDVLTPMGGSFNFDPRGAWTAIDAGYSPNEHGHAIEASPVVEFLSAWGLENARPVALGLRKVRYAAWGVRLPLMLARAALGSALSGVPTRWFRFELQMSGKNKIVTFAQEEVCA